MKHVAALLLPVGVVVVLQASLIASGHRPVFDHELLGPDTYMRMVRVIDLLQSGDWYDRTIERSNAPFGEVLHWTRLMDLLILAGALPLRLGMTPDAALYWSGVFVSPVLHAVTAALIYFAGRQLFAAMPAAMAAVLAVAQPPLYGPFAAGRPDHHGLQLTLFAALILCLMRILNGRTGRASAVATAAVLATALWVSVEALAAAALAFGALGMLWIWRGNAYLRLNREFALAVLVGLAVVLLIDPPNDGLVALVLDRLSVIHLFAFSLTAAFWLAVPVLVGAWGRGARAGAAIVGFLAIGAALWGVDPDVFRGPYAYVDPLVNQVYLSTVAEIQPLIHDSWSKTLETIGVWFGAGLIGIPYLVVLALRRAERERRPQWLLLLAAAVIYGCLSLYQVRWTAYPQIVVAMPLVRMILIALGWIDRHFVDIRRAVARATTMVALGTFFIVFGALVKKIEGPTEIPGQEISAHCKMKELVHQLAAVGGMTTTQRIVANHFFGPEILYRTPHEVLATPYHRNTAGILDAYEILSSIGDEPARTKIAERGVTWILICPVGPEPGTYRTEGAGRSLYDRLVAGELPPWLREISLPGGTTEFRLFEVVR